MLCMRPCPRNSPLRQTMKLPLVRALVVLSLLPGLWAVPSCGAKPARGGPQTASSDTFPNKSVIIYVADFDLEATPAAGSGANPANRAANSPANASASATGTPSAPSANASPASADGANGAKAESQRSEAARGDAPSSDAQKSETGKVDAAKIDPTRVDPPGDDSPRVQAAKLVDLAATTLVKVLEQQGYSARRLRNGASAPDSGVVLRGVFAQVDPEFGIRRVVIGGVATDAKMLL